MEDEKTEEEERLKPPDELSKVEENLSVSDDN